MPPQELRSHRFVATRSCLLRSRTPTPRFRGHSSTRFVAFLGLASLGLIFAASAASRNSGPVEFKVHIIESKIPGGYSLLVADMNRDARPDVIGLSTRMSELAWYENPNWERHVLVREMNGLKGSRVSFSIRTVR